MPDAGSGLVTSSTLRWSLARRTRRFAVPAWWWSPTSEASENSTCARSLRNASSALLSVAAARGSSAITGRPRSTAASSAET